MDRKFLRPGWIVGHLLVVLAVLVCLRLGRWQWDRMHEGGTIQNLGYAVLWPVFGAAFVYMWFRFLQLENLKDAEDDAELTALAAGGPAGESPQIPAGSSVERAPDDRAATPGNTDAVDTSAPIDGGSTDSAPPIDAPAAVDGDAERAPARVFRTTPSTGVTVAVATVGDDDDDPELAAYNRALAALAEKDHRRAR